MKKRDRSGEVVGRLFVIKEGPPHIQYNGRKRITWECRCECGNVIYVEAGNLRASHTTSCGCLVLENCSSVGKKNFRHGKTKTREWYAWRGCRDRCYNPFTPQYVNYGARGIKVCDAWKNSFDAFYKDMGDCPKGFSLERIDVNKNYEPSNCKWASSEEQMRNRRVTPRRMWNGGLKTLRELADEHNLPYINVYERVCRRFWPLKKALSTPVKRRCK